jgi:branched-chain amino acid transport system ATP-binding protein
MLELRGVSCSYGKVQALHGVSLSVPEGSLVSILGANGAGKSTCLKVISRLVRIQEGQVLFLGKDITRTKPAEVMRLGIVQVPEGRMIFPQLNVQENLAMGAYCRRDAAGIRRDLERMYASFPVLKRRSRQIASTLSGGEQQMLAVARGLMARPRILLLDEPSLGLAPVIVEEIFAFLRELKQAGTTILLVEQNAFMALQIADFGYVLETGEITLADKARDLLDNPRVRESYLGITT